MGHVIWTDEALDNVRTVRDYIAQSAPQTAQRFALELLAAADRLALFPRAGQVVPEYGTETVREVLHRGYRILYQIIDDAVYIRVVIHGRRDLRRHIDPGSW